MKRAAAAVLTIVMLLTFSSCSVRLASVDSLIRAPKLTGENQLVQQALDDRTGGNIILKTPAAGDYSSAFVYRDLNGDGVNECVAFYAAKTDANTVHMNILAQTGDGAWRSVGDTAGSGSDVYSLLFADVDGDGNQEIIVTWTILESKGNRYISVYGRYTSSDGVVSLMTELFTSAHTLDVNGDGSAEIFLTSLETSGDSYVAFGRLFSYDRQIDAIEMVGEVRLDPSVTSYASIAHDFSGESCRLFIDGVVSETHMITEIVELRRSDMHIGAATVDGRPSAQATLRSGGAVCADINGDGLVEIPSTGLLEGGESVDRVSGIAEPLYLTAWNRYENGSLSTVYCYIDNADDGFRFEFPQEWRDSVTAVRDTKIRRLKFCALEADGRSGPMLFCIDCADAATSATLEQDGILYQDEKTVYTYLITEYGRERNIGFSDLLLYFTKT